MVYIDGFVLPVKKTKVKEYKALSTKMGKLMEKFGVLKYVECVGDDLNRKGVGMPFPKLAKAKKDEVVFFSFIVYQSKAHRKQVMAKLMKDPFMTDPKMTAKSMPFDMKRMASGGFKAVVDF